MYIGRRGGDTDLAMAANFQRSRRRRRERQLRRRIPVMRTNCRSPISVASSAKVYFGCSDRVSGYTVARPALKPLPIMKPKIIKAQLMAQLLVVIVLQVDHFGQQNLSPEIIMVQLDQSS